MFAAMFGPRISTVFRSRWRALWWAASVLLGVYLLIPRNHADDGASEDSEAVATLLGDYQERTSKPVDPWAKTPD